MQLLSERKRKIIRTIFLSYFIMIVIIILIYVAAMLLYPGGNFVNDDDSWGYSFIYNGLCDMRELTAVNGEPNPYSNVLLKIGTIGITVAMLLFFGTLWTFFQDKISTKILSWIASILGITFGPLNLCLIFLHSTFEIHMIFNILAPLSLNLAVILYTIIYYLDPKLPKINRYSFLVLSIVAVSYSVLVGISSGIIGGYFEMIVHRLGANILHFLTIIIFLIQALGIFYHMKKQ